jgi:serine/threonine protein kinase
MKYAPNRSLSKFLARYPKADSQSPTMIEIVICDIVLGMRYVHSQRILHRDLKPSNSLINKDFRGKICDCGFSRPDDCEGSGTGGTGTYVYCAREQLGADFSLGPATDLSAFGFVSYEMLIGTPPCASGLVPIEIVRRYLQMDCAAIPPEIGPLMKGLIERC